MVATRGQHLLGKVLDSWQLEKLLGYGGSSAVFLAQREGVERKVAIKVFLPRANSDPQMLRDFHRRFLREAEATSELDHPHILPIHSYGEEDGFPYIIMPYLSGGTLAEYVKLNGPLSLEEAQRYLAQISEALDYAHEHGRIHCDVKPANILLDGEGNVFLSDFGIARAMQINPEDDQATAIPEVLMGTPDYISPEQALGHALDGRSDIYSLGVTLFFLLAGHPPFRADSSIAMALLHVHEAPPSLCFIRDDVSPDIDDVVQRALAKQAADRFQTAGEFSEAFTLAVAAAPEWQREQQASGNSDHLLGRVNNYKPAEPIIHVKQLQHYRSPGTGRTSRSRRRLVVAALVVLLVVIGGLLLRNSLALSSLVARRPTATATPRIPLKPLVIEDALAPQYQNFWPTSSTFVFTNGQYHIQNKSPQSVALAFFDSHQFRDFRLSVTLNEVRGSHSGGDFSGLAFRSATDQSHYYVFAVLSGNPGLYEFLRYDGQWQTLDSGSVLSLTTPNAQNVTLQVVANGLQLAFYVNGQQVAAPVLDKSSLSLATGQIGLYVEAQDTEAAFSHLRIESLR